MKTFIIFYFLNKMMKQHVPKTFSYSNSFEKYIATFLQALSKDHHEKFDLLAFKNSKYLFYRFNDFVKAYVNPRYKLLHT